VLRQLKCQLSRVKILHRQSRRRLTYSSYLGMIPGRTLFWTMVVGATMWALIIYGLVKACG